MPQHTLPVEDLPDLTIETLGPATVASPLIDQQRHFTEDSERVHVYSHNHLAEQACRVRGEAPAFEVAGPRRHLHFDPEKMICGVVNCGGLCPGLNDVIRTITLTLTYQYNVRTLYGFRYGYAGLSSNPIEPPILLTPEVVDEIHTRGGSILASSRGPQDVDDMIDQLVRLKIGVLFVIGGDGTLRGAGEIAAGIRRRGLDIGIVGVPKTIDNDIMGIEQSFGFNTAVEQARQAILGAHEEAKGAPYGVGLVKLMGRDSGFIAAAATLANSDVNFCFIPEVPLMMGGEDGFLRRMERRMDRKKHAVVVVAEGVTLTDRPDTEYTRDASGNLVREDIGPLLKQKMTAYFKSLGKPLTVKYIDPSYMIRSCPAESQDSLLCLGYGQYAVHAAMAGKTNMVIGFWNQHFTHIPIALATLRRKTVDPTGYLWQTVLGTTGQEGHSFLR